MIIKKLRQNWIVLTLFTCSLAFWLYQHFHGISWDFASYVLNAKYLFANGFYFEWLRPPLTPFLLWITSGFGLSWLASGHIYIIGVSCLHLFAAIKLADAIKVKREIFYALTLTPFLLNLGMLAGPYLLAFALLELCMFCLLEKKASLSGMFLGLAVLAHYATLIFLPLLFFNKKLKPILISILLFIILIIPWLLFSHLATGNAFMSIFDSYLLNMGREASQSSFEVVKQIALFINYYLIFAVLGIIFFIKEKNQKSKKFEFLLFLSFAVLALISFIKIPYKNPTYFLHFTLPLVYFSSLALNKIKNTKKILVCILIVFAINFSLALAFIVLPYNESYKDAVMNTKDCMTISNEWVPLNYAGRPTALPIRQEDLKLFVDKGYNIVYFKRSDWNSYDLNKLRELPIMVENEYYIAIGNQSLCEPYHKVEFSFQEDKYGKKFNYSEMLKLIFKR